MGTANPIISPAPITTTEFALVADGWFDGEHHHPGPTTFHVAQGRLQSATPGDHGAALAQRGLAVHRGGFVLPGLVDAHVHLFLDGSTTDNAVRAAHLKQGLPELTEAARRSARQALACGITLVRDAGDRHGINNAVRDESLAHPGRLPHIRSGGLGVKRPQRYGAFMARDVEDDEAIRQSVHALAQHNDEIKLILTGIIDFKAGAVTDEPQFDLDSTRLVVQTARACGRNTFVHCSGPKGLAIAAEAGVGSIEHGFFMDRDTLLRMRDLDVAWTPTFCPVHFQWAHPEAVGWPPDTVDNLRRILDSHARHVALAAELGVRLLLGTDAGSMGVPHGQAVFDEIERYLAAGLSLSQTLHAATAQARRHFGLGPALLRPGAPWDAVWLADSPFQRVDALRHPMQVWVGEFNRP